MASASGKAVAVQEQAAASESSARDDPMVAAMEQRLWLVRALQRLLQFVAPLSLGAVAVKLVGYLTGRHKHLLFHPTSRLLTLVNFFFAGESAFAVACAVHRHRSQALLCASRRPPASSEAQRRETFERCLNTVARPTEFATKWLRDFELQHIKRGNVEDWLSWGMFDKKHSALSAAELAELAQYIAQFEARVGHPLEEGHNGNIRCYKFDHEPVESLHRPLVYYAVVHGVLQRVALPLALRYLGFGGMQACGSFNYFVRRARRPSGQEQQPPKAPIVVIHGIGIGPLPYCKFVADLVAEDGEQRDVVVIELPAVAQQIFPADLLPQLFVRDVRAMLSRVGHAKARFVGHSYGTFTLSWIVKRAPECADSLVFLDPAPFLLHDSSVLRAIVYKEAQDEAEELFKYFLRAEMFFNSHTRRHFLWQENLLFFEQIPADIPTLLVLSEKDEIMPVPGILTLFEGTPGVDHIELLFLEQTTHGGLLFTEQGQRVVDRIIHM